MTTTVRILSTVLACCTLALSACGGPSDAPSASAAPEASKTGAKPAGGGSGPGAAAPVTITSALAVARDMPVVLKATGTVVPSSSVDVKAQVTSVVTRVHVREGQFVKAGELLFTLDARAEEANAAKARAQLAKNQVALADAQRQLARASQLLDQKFVSQGAVDSAQALVDGLQAALAVDGAAIDAVRVALSNARIVAPLTGRVGQVPVAVGNAVQANVTTLVTVTQLDPIDVAFSLPQRNLSDGLAALNNGGGAVSATLADGGGRFTGRLRFVDSLVDAGSGTVKAKAVFDNKDSQLWPGAFVEVAQVVRVIQGAVVVPQAAIIQSARGAMVYVVEDGKASARAVQTLYAQDGEAAVSGVNVGDAVIVDGRQNVRPGSMVVERASEPQSAVSAEGQERGKPLQPPASEAAAAGKP
ncbi:efflux RND transporter periplasmic adaptor subunit [Hydrogenophaga crassostreae]|nr:efflux RND transporter periplasmic adaptor subunit [Hydrogenophaga crassostreae]